MKTATGISHLVPEEYDDLSIDPLQFSAVGTPQDDLPLVLTERNLYFQRFYEYENTVAQAISERVKKPLHANEPEILEFSTVMFANPSIPGRPLRSVSPCRNNSVC